MISWPYQGSNSDPLSRYSIPVLLSRYSIYIYPENWLKYECGYFNAYIIINPFHEDQ